MSKGIDSNLNEDFGKRYTEAEAYAEKSVIDGWAWN